MSWRKFILALGLHTAEEMETVGFGLYWAESGRDPMLRLCHRLIACSIFGRSQTPEILSESDGCWLNQRPLYICEELDDTWAWVAPGPERQPNVVAGAPKAIEDAPAIDEGAPANPAPIQAPQPPHAAPKTMPQRIARLEEDVHE
ncbi:hypothetical protein Tco_1413300 [Tanacetum coccineum]